MASAAESLYEELRPRAFAIAYRMLGSVGEAEDVVQEAFLRLHRVLDAGEEISSPAAYVATVVSRLAIDELRSARARRETYVGEWLPEPMVTGDGGEGPGEAVAAAAPSPDPAREAELSDSLSLAFLVLLESLTPEQRAAFLLHDVFDYPYREVAEIVGRSEAATRQLATRARARIGEGRPRQRASRDQERRLAERFFAATRDGDVEALEQMLAADVELHGDGGGKVPALARPIYGRERAVRTLAAWGHAVERIGGISYRPVEVNGQSGALTLDSNGHVLNVVVLDIAEGQIQAVRSVANPDKLGHLGPVGDVRALLQRWRASGRRERSD
jgi:RNA polymerase sigma-70 factor (TIGR02957 family)